MPCWWIRELGLERMARSVEQLQAWRELLELCEDECRVFDTTKAMRTAVLEVERELWRLHKLEDAAIGFAKLHEAVDAAGGDSDDAIFDLFEQERQYRSVVRELVPEAFEAQG